MSSNTVCTPDLLHLWVTKTPFIVVCLVLQNAHFTRFFLNQLCLQWLKIHFCLVILYNANHWEIHQSYRTNILFLHGNQSCNQLKLRSSIKLPPQHFWFHFLNILGYDSKFSTKGWEAYWFHNPWCSFIVC